MWRICSSICLRSVIFLAMLRIARFPRYVTRLEHTSTGIVLPFLAVWDVSKICNPSEGIVLASVLMSLGLSEKSMPGKPMASNSSFE